MDDVEHMTSCKQKPTRFVATVCCSGFVVGAAESPIGTYLGSSSWDNPGSHDLRCRPLRLSGNQLGRSQRSMPGLKNQQLNK